MRHGSACIESEHFLLGILRENEAVAKYIAGPAVSVADLRREIGALTTPGRAMTEPVEVPLSTDCKRILTTAVEEAEALGYKQVSIGHFLPAILRVETSAAARILESHGATILRFRKKSTRDIRCA
jgi:ATP-dependent Clp protease ATP-binding subunit ClpA